MVSPGRPAPALVIAAPGSGHGKTTVASGLMGALRAEGLEVAGFKIGPDYIDPGYHTLATGRPGRNLDPYLCRPDQIVPLLLHGAEVPRPADMAVVEGVMGLFDGQIGGEGYASTAHVARLITAPVVVVLDISHMSRTAAAVVHGLSTFEPGLAPGRSDRQQGGVGPARAARSCRRWRPPGSRSSASCRETPGSRLRLATSASSRRRSATTPRPPWTGWPAQVAEHVDLTQVLAVAHAAPSLDGEPWRPGRQVCPAVASAAGGRRRRRSRLHLPLPGDRRVAPGRRL